MSDHLARWHNFIQTRDHEVLKDMLADEVVFTSPVVHTPQRGRNTAFIYLAFAEDILGGEAFHYLREFDCGDRAVLEFETVVDGITVNGVDMIEWDESGKITDFKVMVRPLKAVNIVKEKMGEKLAHMKTEGAG